MGIFDVFDVKKSTQKIIKNNFQKITAKFIEDNSDIKFDSVIVCIHSNYLGGDLRNPVNKETAGFLGLTNKFVFFVAKNNFVIKIPFKCIQTKKIETGKREDSTHETLAAIYTTGGMGLNKRQTIIIPYLDENKMNQIPKFSTYDMQEFGKAFYEKITKR